MLVRSNGARIFFMAAAAGCEIVWAKLKLGFAGGIFGDEGFTRLEILLPGI